MISDSERRWVDSMSEAYQRWLAPVVFEPFAVDLVRRVAASNPRRVLELAAGTGVVTEHLCRALPDADITATDLNEPMVAFGRSHVPLATWRRADALALPFDDISVDTVVCQFGVMFFPDKRTAYAEMQRVLEPGGILLVNTWDVVSTHDFAAALSAALDQLFPNNPPTFITAIPHGYADPDIVVDDIRRAGFQDVRLDTITLLSPPASAVDVAVGFCTGTPLRAEIEARGDLEPTTERIADLVRSLLGDGLVIGRMSAHVVQASSP